MVKTSKTLSANGIWQSEVNFAGQESIGQRSGQEDYSLFRLLKGGAELLVVLADGMGGHTSGEVASKNVVTVFDSTFVDYPSESVPAKLGASLQQANHQLSKLIQANNSLDGMGCTLIGAHVSSDGLRWISVGDSLLYIYRDGKLIHLNADHSMAPVIEESYRSGKITKEEALTHPNKNALRSAVMGEDIPLIDSPKHPTPLFRGDIVIVASDGLLTLSEDKVCNLLRINSGKAANVIAKVLIDAVNAVNKPHQDNTTIQILIAPSSFKKQNNFTKKIILLAVSLIVFSFAMSAIYLLNPFGLMDRFSLSGDLSRDSTYSTQPVPLPSAAKPINADASPLEQDAADKNNATPAAKKSDSTKSEGNKTKPPNSVEIKNKVNGNATKPPISAKPESGGSMAAAGGLEHPVMGSAGTGATQTQEAKPSSDSKPIPAPVKPESHGE